MKTSTFLRRLESLKNVYGNEAAARRLDLLRTLARRRLETGAEVERLHEILCFLRAYPDDRAVLDDVEDMLSGFAERSDLRQHAADLVNTGIAGTAIEHRLYWFTASWLAHRCPDELVIDWPELESAPLLDRRLTLLMSYVENLALDEAELTPREWIRRLRGPDETEAVFLTRRFERLKMDSFLREAFYEELDVPYRIEPGPDTPSRTRARHRPSPVVFQTRPLSRSRSLFRPALEQPPRSVKAVGPAAAGDLIRLARDAMITRDRDLDVFIHADVKDVRMIDCGDGLQFACYGAVPERRQVLDAVYGLLALKNGVPVGYILSSALYESAEFAYNVFDTYRGTEAARLLGASASVVRHLFGADTLLLDPYQLGYGNLEGLASGAWWFYYKLGFRPKDAETRRLVRIEQKRMKADPSHRTSIDDLQELSAANMYLHLGEPRTDVIGVFSRENVGMHVVDYLSRRFGAEREEGLRICAEEVAHLLGVRSRKSFSRGERIAWERWAPLVQVLPGVKRWSRANKTALARVVRAKGGRRESDFVRRFDAHRPLRRALMKLSTSQP